MPLAGNPNRENPPSARNRNPDDPPSSLSSSPTSTKSFRTTTLASDEIVQAVAGLEQSQTKRRERLLYFSRLADELEKDLHSLQLSNGVNELNRDEDEYEMILSMHAMASSEGKKTASDNRKYDDAETNPGERQLSRYWQTLGEPQRTIGTTRTGKLMQSFDRTCHQGSANTAVSMVSLMEGADQVDQALSRIEQCQAKGQEVCMKLHQHLERLEDRYRPLVELDVLAGREKMSHSHVGNKSFLAMIKSHRKVYQNAPSHDAKTKLRMEQRHEGGPEGRMRPLQPHPMGVVAEYSKKPAQSSCYHAAHPQFLYPVEEDQAVEHLAPSCQHGGDEERQRYHKVDDQNTHIDRDGQNEEHSGPSSQHQGDEDDQGESNGRNHHSQVARERSLLVSNQSQSSGKHIDKSFAQDNSCAFVAVQRSDNVHPSLRAVYSEGQDVTKDPIKEMRLNGMATNQGHPEACFNPSCTHEFARDVIQDCTKAPKLYQLAAHQGSAHAQYMLGVMCEKGKYAPHDDAKAMEWFQLAANQGHSDAQYKLGYNYYNGYGVSQDFTRAMEWLQLATNQGQASAQFNLGIMHENGQGVPQSLLKAMELFKLASDQGHTGAKYKMAHMYYNGQGVSQDFKRAMELYHMAACQGIANAQLQLGDMYCNGQGEPQDFRKAMKWYQKAAMHGVVRAQFKLGMCFHDGKGVLQDYAKAAAWFHVAANQGNAQAQRMLGITYHVGQGVTQDHTKAMKWIQLAANQGGDSQAQFLLGIMYHIGQGVSKDQTKAMQMYQLASNQGHLIAKVMSSLWTW